VAVRNNCGILTLEIKNKVATFPGGTSRVLTEKELKEFGEYRAHLLVLEAWERIDSKDSRFCGR